MHRGHGGTPVRGPKSDEETVCDSVNLLGKEKLQVGTLGTNRQPKYNQSQNPVL